MTGDEVAPDDQIRFAVVGRKIDAMSPAIADLLEDLAEGALVQRFAVHDNAVHVKNKCVESFHGHHGKLPALSEALHEPTHPGPLPGGVRSVVRSVSVPLMGGLRVGSWSQCALKKRGGSPRTSACCR